MHQGIAAIHSLARAGQARGLGRSFHRGFGVLGPLGNASSIATDEFQVTGDGVYLWNGNQSNAGSITQLNRGDRVVASGEVVLDVGNGKYYAKVQSDKAPNAPEAWIAVEYLAPLDWKAPAAPPAQPPPEKPPVLMTGAAPASWTPWLIGLGALALIGGGFALFGGHKGKGKGARHARRKKRRG